jgi:transcriptional regulator CtsR
MGLSSSKFCEDKFDLGFKELKGEYDAVHKESLNGLLKILTKSRESLVNERNILNSSVDEFARYCVGSGGDKFNIVSAKINNVVKKHSEDMEEYYSEVLRGMVGIVRNHKADLSENSYTNLVTRMEDLLGIERNMGESYQMRQLVDTEDLLYGDKLSRNHCYRSLLINCINSYCKSKDTIHHMYSTLLCKVNDDIIDKEKGYMYQHDREIKIHLHNELHHKRGLISSSQVPDTANQAKTVEEILCHYFDDSTERRDCYMVLVKKFLDELAVNMEYNYSELVKMISSSVKDYTNVLVKQSHELPSKINLLVSRSDSLIYQNYRRVKGLLVEIIRNEGDLVKHKSEDLIAEMMELRRQDKEINTHMITARRDALLKALQYLCDEGRMHAESKCSDMVAKLENRMAEDKVFFSRVREELSVSTIKVLKEDECSSASLKRDMILRVSQMVSKTGVVQEIQQIAKAELPASELSLTKEKESFVMEHNGSGEGLDEGVVSA